MATSTDKQNTLNALLGEYGDYGFRLEEPDSEMLNLYFQDKCIAEFYQEKVTLAIILEGCKNYLANILRG